MTDVTRYNFAEVCPQISEVLKKCSFVGIDTEFTSLTANSSCVTSLFDSGNQRYEKLRESAQSSVLSQIGLAIFTQDRNTLNYEVETYNFYLCPQSCGSQDKRFLCQASSFEFLARHKFDFNKTFSEGISFLNRNEASQLREELSSGSLMRATERNLSHDEEDKIESICKNIRHEPEYDFAEDIDGLSPGAKFILYEEVAARFPQYLSSNMHSKDKNIVEDVMKEIHGFSIIIEYIIELKKPLVGHNCLSDLMRMYQCFVDELPKSYKQFKKVIHATFPEVYDTKHMAYCSRRQLEDSNCINLTVSDNLRNTSLNELYNNILKSKPVSGVFMYTPVITHSNLTPKYMKEDFCHEAGFDAVMSGAIFIRIAHLMAGMEYLSFGQMKPLYFSEHLGSVEKFRNLINVGRGAISYINLQDDDPHSERPACLFVSSKLTPSQIAELFARYGSVDVKPLKSQNENLVAVANYRTERDILLAFQNDTRLRVTKYNPWKHDKHLRRKVILSGFCGIMALLATLAFVRK